MKDSENCIFRMDFTLFDKDAYVEFDNIDKLKAFLHENCKKWVFQLERCPETDKEHFQGRLHLKNKTRCKTLMKRLQEAVPMTGRLSPTCSITKGFDYVMKMETRISGPWRDEGYVSHIPWDVKDIKLLPWQDSLEKMIFKPELRKIDIIYDVVGNIGKTTFAKYCAIHHQTMLIPPFNDIKMIMQAVCAAGPRTSYIIDLPRALAKEKMAQFFAGLEMIKSGVAQDTRYTFNQLIMDPPRVFVFTNYLPEVELLSKDRWMYWNVAGGMLQCLQNVPEPNFSLLMGKPWEG